MTTASASRARAVWRAQRCPQHALGRRRAGVRARAARARRALMAAKKSAPTAKSPRAAKRRGRAARPRAHARLLLDRLLERYPDAHCALDFTNAFELLCATILSAQCTDKRVNMVTPALFARYPDAARARRRAPGRRRGADQEHGLLSQQGEEPHRHGDGARRAPRRRGAGRHGRARRPARRRPQDRQRRLGNAFGRNDGIVVDTHVTRLANRLGLTRHRRGEDRAGPPCRSSRRSDGRCCRTC